MLVSGDKPGIGPCLWVLDQGTSTARRTILKNIKSCIAMNVAVGDEKGKEKYKVDGSSINEGLRTSKIHKQKLLPFRGAKEVC